MDTTIVTSTASGKTVGSKAYFHVSTLSALAPDAQALCRRAIELARLEPERDFNVVRIDLSTESVALLQYPQFFNEAFPGLERSWKVDLHQLQVTLRNYEDSYNPPVLHRKELLLNFDDTQRLTYERLTKELESLGLFDDPVRIGFRLQWQKLLAERGFRVVDHQLVAIGNVEPEPKEAFDGIGPVEIARHLTALSRQNFSAPIQILQRFGYLDGSRTVFDYGCGKGDDLRGLLTNGIQAGGWDPHYAPTEEVVPARVVNLGFVINVIEDPVERREALKQAFSLAEELLVVSTMIATDNPGRVTLYGDGVLTSRATFQKYYTQSELRGYLTETLGEEPIPVAPGVFFVFKDKEAEQRFQFGRQRKGIRVRPLVRPPHAEAADLTERRRRSPDRYQMHQALLTPLWERSLELGREPDEDEIQNLGEVEQALGSLKKALRITFANNNLAQLEQARSQRVDELKVFLSLQQFQRRTPYKTLEPGLQRDIRAFFRDYTSAQDQAKHLLFQVAQPEVLDECCRVASEQGLGWLEPSHSLQLHSSLVPRLPAPLRVYVGCAAVIYGDVSEADVVKIHIRSGKVSFMKYDDFLGKAIPKMTERTKIDLRNLDLQLFTYGAEYPCPPLYLKSRYINEELPYYAEQLAFDEALQGLNIDLSGYGLPEAEFSAAMERARWQVNGFRLERLHRVPNLDDPCGRFLTYRQLIECGETQAATKITNLPKNPESYTALFDLATAILDPVIEYFGGIELTYGFCSQVLAKYIPARIAPKLDQHAAYEHKRTGAPICPRLGAAVDFLVRDEDMKEVADWIIANLPFDRLYYYGSNHPLHVSFGHEHKREAIQMLTLDSGRRVPRPLPQTHNIS